MKNQDKTFVFINEMGISCSTQRNRGRSKRGRRCIILILLSKCPKVRVCITVSKGKGIIHYSIQNSAFDSESISDFTDKLIGKCNDIGLQNVSFNIDNFKNHKKDEEITNICKKNKIKLVFLPPYNPKFNPIDNTFSIIISYIKKILKTK